MASTPACLPGAISTRRSATGAASTPATRTGMASARCTSTPSRGSGPCCARGCARIGASRKTSCRSISASSSSCTMHAVAAKPCLARSSPPWSHNSPDHHPGSQQEPEKFCTIVGGVISPLLANVYLHYVFDLWAERWRRREARGDMIIVRYADDIVVGFEHEADARRFRDAMRARLEEFALSLHPDKTRLIEFGRHAAARRRSRGLGKPETFAFLGFTFICGTARRGGFQVQRKSRRDRVRAKLGEVKAELRRRMHQPIPAQGLWLRRVVTGFFAYHGVPTNGRALAAFRFHVLDLWRRTLRRRSQRDDLAWERVARLADDWLPRPRILRPWPQQRFAARHPRWEPYAGNPHVRFCAGGAQ